MKDEDWDCARHQRGPINWSVLMDLTGMSLERMVGDNPDQDIPKQDCPPMKERFILRLRPCPAFLPVKRDHLNQTCVGRRHHCR